MEGNRECKICMYVYNVGNELDALTFVIYLTKCIQSIIMYRKEKIYIKDKHLLFYLFCFIFIG